MNLTYRLTLAAVLAASVAAPAARAQTFIDTDTLVTTALTKNVALGSAGTNPVLTLNNVGGTTGSIDYHFVAYSGSLVMNGGTIFGDVYAFNSSNLSFLGGTVNGNIFAYTNGVLDFFGSNLTATAASSAIAGFRGVTISGNLTSGTAINKTIYLHNDSNAVVELNGANTGLGFVPSITPEPGSVALLVGLGVTGAGFAAKRRRARA